MLKDKMHFEIDVALLKIEIVLLKIIYIDGRIIISNQSLDLDYFYSFQF